MLLAMDYPRASVSPTQYRGIAGSGDEIVIVPVINIEFTGLGEAKILVAGGIAMNEWTSEANRSIRTRVYCRRETNLFAIEAFSGELLV